MTVHTNRKGRTYFLCKGMTKTGKTRYFFSREQKGEPVEEIPTGYEIVESVNGVVSLAKIRPKLIDPSEIAAVEGALQQHPEAKQYKVNVRHDMIEIYERVGADLTEVIDGLFGLGHIMRRPSKEFLEKEERLAQYTPVLRFILYDEAKRRFGVQRMCYLGGIDGFIDICAGGNIEDLAKELIPTLGTDEFFELI